LSHDGNWAHILGTDEQGRDLLSAIFYGLRASILIAVAAVAVSLIVGTALGLVSGFRGGAVDAILMRVIDVKLSFPTLLVALLASGIATAMVPANMREALQIYILIFAIGFSSWPRFARTVRAGVMVEKEKDYVIAARVIGVRSIDILLKHILPNIMPPLLVIATLMFGLAVIDEATISFLGVGLPPSQPSLGTLIRLGQEAIYSGEWWVAVFPILALLTMVLGVNLFGDWLRDVLNPRLR
jgi:peptide/nickel transport system permease protein